MTVSWHDDDLHDTNQQMVKLHKGQPDATSSGSRELHMVAGNNVDALEHNHALCATELWSGVVRHICLHGPISPP
jgi:hypothetical protein